MTIYNPDKIFKPDGSVPCNKLGWYSALTIIFCENPYFCCRAPEIEA